MIAAVACTSACGSGPVLRESGAEQPPATSPGPGSPAASQEGSSTRPPSTGTATTGSPGPVVATPTPGSIDQVVPSKKAGPRVTAKDDVADLPGGVTVRLVKARPVTIKPIGPGDTKGPGVATELKITNNSGGRISIDTAVVHLTYGAGGRPGELSPSADYAPFAGSLGTGASASATYLFRVPRSAQQNFSLTVAYVAGAPVAAFARGR